MAGDYLKRILAAEVRKALFARDCVQKLDELRGQAHVWLYVTAAREFHIAIWRSKSFPSESEWWTFLRALPDEIRPAKLPHYEQARPNKDRWVFKAHWRLSTPNPFGESDDEQTTPAPTQRPTPDQPARRAPGP